MSLHFLRRLTSRERTRGFNRRFGMTGIVSPPAGDADPWGTVR